MSDELTPDGFGRELRDRLHAAADHLDGAGVTRAGVAAAVEADRRRRTRTRAVAVGAAAAIALLAGIAVAARSGGSDREQVSSGGATTTLTDPCADREPPLSDPLAWFRLSDAQADALYDADVITAAQAAGHARHAVALSYDDLKVIGDPPIEPYGEQLFHLGAIDRQAIDYLRGEGVLSSVQETEIADGLMPRLDQAQADQLLDRFPSLVAFPAGGGPIRYTGESEAPAVDPSVTTTAPAGAQGETPFDEWVAVLRAKDLLTPEQETEAAAGRGFALTSEQSAALQEYWDQQSAGTTTTAPAFAPGPDTTTSTADGAEPCTPDPTVTTTEQTTTPIAVTTATAPVTSATTAVPEDGTWIVYLYVLNGQRNDDGSITPAIDMMAGIMAGSGGTEEALAQEARDAATGHAVFEGDLACDTGAAEQLGLDPALGQLGISVGFTTEAAAEAFAKTLDDSSSDLEPMGPIFVAQTCAGRPAAE